MFMSSFLGVADALLVLIILFLISQYHNVCPLLVVVMFMNFFLITTNAFLVLMVFFLVNCDHAVHELLS